VHLRLRHQHRPASDRRGEHSHTEEALRYIRRRYLSAEGARSFAAAIANATFAARREVVWGTGTGAVASDSTHFGAFDQNLFTQHHIRYGGRGVLIYWHVDKKSVAINSQLISCTASEVAAMIEGAMHHRTEMDVQANYVRLPRPIRSRVRADQTFGVRAETSTEADQRHQALPPRPAADP